MIRADNSVYSGTIGYLLNNRKDLLKLDIDGDITYKVNKGYYCKIL